MPTSIPASAAPETSSAAAVAVGRRRSERDPNGFRSIVAQVWRRRLPRFGLLALLFMTLAAITAPFSAPYDPARQDLLRTLEGPTGDYLFGTDDLGRDILSRVIHGARASLTVGFVAVSIAGVAGISVGMLAGYRGGWVDEVLMRGMDALWALPSLILALAIVAALGPSLSNAMIAIGAVYAPAFARLARAEVLKLREWDFVLAARALGAPGSRILRVHLWPNALGPLVIQATYLVSQAILIEATLSFLGLGTQPPTPSWGAMLQSNYAFIELQPWASVLPGAAIFLTVLGFNFLGDGLRDALDVRTRGTD